MKRLLRVELTRLRWRRSVVFLIAAALLIPLVILASTAWSTRPVGAAELAAAEEQAAAEAAQPWIREELERCEREPEMYGVGDGSGFETCAEAVVPRPENYLYRSPLDLAQMVNDGGAAVVTLMALILFVVGTTFAGHDWNTGSLSNQLLFEPRRLRIWSAKALAVSLTALVVAALALVAFWGGAAAVAAARHIDTDAQVWRDIVWFSGRAVALVAAAALAGYALTMLFRSTVASLVLAFLVVAAVPLVAVAVFTETAIPWLLPTNAAAFLQDGYDYVLWQGQCATTGVVEPCERTVSLAQAATYVGSLLVLLVVASLQSFRRRDVP